MGSRLGYSQLKAFRDWQFSPEGQAHQKEKIKNAWINQGENRPEHKKRVGFTFNTYKSGEVTGSRFCTGSEIPNKKTGRTGALVSDCLTQPAKTKIRRAIQNSDDKFRCFMTVTFSPADSEMVFVPDTPEDDSVSEKDLENYQKWLRENTRKPGYSITIEQAKEILENEKANIKKDSEVHGKNVIDQRWAKEKFKTFINTIKVHFDRRAKKENNEKLVMAYVWVAEIQQKNTDNIHFHVLLKHRVDIAWLTKIWGQTSNAIEVAPIRSLNHASCYLRKYMSKGNSRIEGNRYGISQNLRRSMMPKKKTSEGKQLTREILEIIESMKDTIEANGGKVLDFGFYIPTPAKKVTFRNKKGEIKKTMPVSAELSPYLFARVDELINTNPF